MAISLALLLYLSEYLAWTLAGVAVGLAIEWRWRVCDRILRWGARRWTSCEPG